MFYDLYYPMPLNFSDNWEFQNYCDKLIEVDLKKVILSYKSLSENESLGHYIKLKLR